MKIVTKSLTWSPKIGCDTDLDESKRDDNFGGRSIGTGIRKIRSKNLSIMGIDALKDVDDGDHSSDDEWYKESEEKRKDDDDGEESESDNGNGDIDMRSEEEEDESINKEDAVQVISADSPKKVEDKVDTIQQQDDDRLYLNIQKQSSFKTLESQDNVMLNMASARQDNSARRQSSRSASSRSNDAWASDSNQEEETGKVRTGSSSRVRAVSLGDRDRARTNSGDASAPMHLHDVEEEH